MTCPRCQGFMCREYAVSYRYADSTTWLWACVQCGNRIDEMILFNRQIQKEFETAPMKQRDRIWFQILRDVARADEL